MGLSSSKKTTDTSPAAQEYRAAKEALANDPVNRGELGYVDADSEAGCTNQAVQDRLNAAEQAYRS